MQSRSLAAHVQESRIADGSRLCDMRDGLDHHQELAIPHLFRCPISLDVFTDPVTLCTGQTYDRANIERWLQLGNLTCPVTMQRLHDPSVVPNHTLRHLVEQWTRLGRHPVDPDRPLIALKHDLQSHETPCTDRLLAVQKLRALSEESPSRCSRLILLGFLPMLLELVFSEAERLNFSHRFIEEGLACSIRLLDAADPSESSRSLIMLKEKSKLVSFHELFYRGTSVVRTSLCRLIDVICSYQATQELSTMLVGSGTFLQELIILLHQGDSEVVLEAGLRAVKSLCSVEPNRDTLVQSGVVDRLVGHIQDAAGGSTTTHMLAISALELTLGLEKAREALINHPDGIKSLVKMVFQVPDLGASESAVSCLTIVCESSLRAREAAIGFGVLTQLLLLLQSHCSGRTKTRARVLLKLLRSKDG